MELDWLETFLAVVDRGGFTAASAQVHRSQSRVSAHIASLEREIGVRLIDRTRRPATVTEAGRVFAGHAREILADVRTARSAVAAMRALSDQFVVVRTTPGLGASVFPPVLADVLARFPEATVTLVERDWSADESELPSDAAALVVAPADREPEPSARRQVLWWEPLRLLVPADHEFTQVDLPVSPCRLGGHRLVVSATAGRVLAPVLDAPAGGRPEQVRVTVDAPETLVTMIRSGLGLGVVTASCAALPEQAGLIAMPLDIADDASTLGVEVAVDWYDVLLDSPVGRALQEAVLAAPAPVGAVDRRR